MNVLTTQPLGIASASVIEPEFIRLPKTGARDPLFSLTRSALNDLILPTKANDFKPPVRSVVLRKRGAKTGIRLIEVASLRKYLRDHYDVAPSQVLSGGSRE
jgi:hypothetical protein